MKELIQKVKELLSDPSRWIQGQLAIREPGGGDVRLILTPRDLYSMEASCFCLEGAFRVAAHDLHTPYKHCDVHEVFQKIVPGKSMHVWNDENNRKHEEVLDVLDKMEQYVSSLKRLGE